MWAAVRGSRGFWARCPREPRTATPGLLDRWLPTCGVVISCRCGGEPTAPDHPPGRRLVRSPDGDLPSRPLDELADDRRAGDLRRHEQATACLSVREQQQLQLVCRRVQMRRHPGEVPPGPARDVAV